MVSVFKIARPLHTIPDLSPRDLSHMDSPLRGLSPKIRLPSVVLTKEGVNPRESGSKSLCSRWPLRQEPQGLWLNRIQSLLICVKSLHFVNFFMQNEPNSKKAKISIIPYITNDYAKICSLVQPKNEPKTKPNEPNSKPIQTQFKPNQTQPVVSLSNLNWLCFHRYWLCF